MKNNPVGCLDCVLGSAVGRVAWQLQASPGVPLPSIEDVHFREFNSRTTAGGPVDASGRLPGSRQLRQPEDAAAISDYADPVFVLGNEWNPKPSPFLEKER